MRTMGRLAMAALLMTMAAAHDAVGQFQARPAATPQAVTGEARVLKYAPGMVTSLQAAETDLVEFSNGRRVTVSQLRQLETAAQILRQPKVDRTPVAMKLLPATTGTPVRNGAELAAALKGMKDRDTVTLPSGRRATIAQIRLVQPLVEKKLGRKLDVAPQAATLVGTPVKISATMTRQEWDSLLKRPDATVLESPGGQRITVGQAKQYMAANPRGPLPRAVPAGSKPAAQTPPRRAQ